MTLTPSLAEQRASLQGKLQAQRREVAEQLTESRARGRFPRSITMRVLMRQPDLAGRLVALIAGARVAGSVSALLVILQALRAARIESHDGEMRSAVQTGCGPARLIEHPPDTGVTSP